MRASLLSKCLRLFLLLFLLLLVVALLLVVVLLLVVMLLLLLLAIPLAPPLSAESERKETETGMQRAWAWEVGAGRVEGPDLQAPQTVPADADA
jgi:hypothetical protein